MAARPSVKQIRKTFRANEWIEWIEGLNLHASAYEFSYSIDPKIVYRT